MCLCELGWECGHMYMSVCFMNVHKCVWVYKSMKVSGWMCVSVQDCVYMYLQICECVYEHTWVYPRTSLCECVCMFVQQCACVHAKYMYICIHMSVCYMSASMCACQCTCERVCKYMHICTIFEVSCLSPLVVRFASCWSSHDLPGTILTVTPTSSLITQTEGVCRAICNSL